MKYKVTTRGWIVFSLLGILLVYAIIAIGGSLINGSNDGLPNDRDQLVSNQNSNNSASDVVEDDHDDVTDSTNEDETSSSSDSVEDSESEQETTPEGEAEDDSVEDSVAVKEVDMSLRLEIIFDKNVHLLKPEYHATLNEWAEILLAYDDLILKVEGHINGFPYYNDGTYGLNIAESRAEIVKSYMIEQGVNADRIETINKGSSDQAVKTDNLEEHYRNRRAVLYFDKK